MSSFEIVRSFRICFFFQLFLSVPAALQSISIIDKGHKITDKLEKSGQELKSCCYDSQIKVTIDPDGQLSAETRAEATEEDDAN